LPTFVSDGCKKFYGTAPECPFDRSKDGLIFYGLAANKFEQNHFFENLSRDNKTTQFLTMTLLFNIFLSLFILGAVFSTHHFLSNE
jgi:hypothetical protein